MSGTHGVFQHVSGYFYTMLEEDFCEVYKAEGKNEVCRAYITSILEHLTNKQYEATGSDRDIWVFMSLPEMSRRMRHAFGERTIHKEIQGMIADGYLFKRRAYGKATMEYRLNLRKLRKALEALPEKQPCNSATYHLANLQDQSSKNARLTLQNSKNDLAELQPRITIEEPLEETENKEREGANAPPTPADLLEDVIETHDEVQLELRRITGEHAAIHTNETQYHIANGSAIGNDEFVLHAPGMLTLAAKKGQRTHGNDIPVYLGTGMGHTHGDHHTEDHQQITSQQAPGPAALPSAAEAPPRGHPAAVVPPLGRSHGISSDQAISASEPAQAATPPAAGSGASVAPTAQASGRRRQPRGNKLVPIEPPKITLLAQEQVCWDLWRNVWFNKGIELELTPTAYGHVRKLAPHITTQEQMESLVKRARQDLEDNAGVKRKTVHLGNCVNSLPGWKQEQQAQGPPEEKPMDKYTAASKDKDRLERGLQRLRDMAIAEGKELPS